MRLLLKIHDFPRSVALKELPLEETNGRNRDKIENMAEKCPKPQNLPSVIHITHKSIKQTNDPTW
jgi:hypothetical protein